MKQKRKKLGSKLLGFLLTLALVLGLMPGMGLTAYAADGDTSYTLTIPSTLSVANSGWNATSGLTAAVTSGDTFDSSKKLSVTATSTNSWSLVSGSNSVGYNLATTTGAYSSSATPASWAFSAAELNETSGTNKDMGIIVEDYSTKPAGTYQDTVTFTASVVSAIKILTLTGRLFGNSGIVEKSIEIEYTDNDTWKDIAERYDEVSLRDSDLGPEGKIVMFWRDMSQGLYGCELKSNELLEPG